MRWDGHELSWAALESTAVTSRQTPLEVEVFAHSPANLEESIGTATLPVIIAGDFNVMGSAVTGRRDDLLCEMA